MKKYRNCIARRWPYMIYCTIKVTIFEHVLSRIYKTLCEPLEIPGGQPMVDPSKVENHRFRPRQYETLVKPLLMQTYTVFNPRKQ